MALTSTMITQLNNSNMAHQKAQIGTLLGQIGPVGDVYYLDAANGSDSNAGTAPASAGCGPTAVPAARAIRPARAAEPRGRCRG